MNRKDREDCRSSIEKMKRVLNAGNSVVWACQVKCVSSFSHLFPQLRAV